uniref:PWI domain-containing protein n=1 Tax=Alexandrium monilatum TaxID=311494 RepID=A0A7S4SIX6_9DINO|mmetsp:Transcript_109096/g.326311  ORF Transcript_109096/g.326311 Transcript_109096/m.326311 type:complete len:207 (-) Transcript_109096:82-702(-)
MAGFFRGTSTDQVKCVNAEQKLIKELDKKARFPPHFSQKVNMSKVSMDVMKPWIAQRITELMGFEDDIVVDYCITQLTEVSEKGLDPKMLQVNMTGFMERKAAPFCSELWKHLLSAQESPVGVPREFIDKKKDDLQRKREEAEKVQEELKRRRQELEEASGVRRDQRRTSHSRSRDRGHRGSATQSSRGEGGSPSPRAGRRRRRFE